MQIDGFKLTNREIAVVRLVSDGLSAGAIAKELNIARCTVERHVENVRLKTRTRNRVHMIAYIIKEGLLFQEATSLPQLELSAQWFAASSQAL